MGGPWKDKGHAFERRAQGKSAHGPHVAPAPRVRQQNTAVFRSPNIDQRMAIPEERAESPGANHPQLKKGGHCLVKCLG